MGGPGSGKYRNGRNKKSPKYEMGIQAKITKEQHERLLRRAYKEDKFVSEIIRHSIEIYLNMVDKNENS